MGTCYVINGIGRCGTTLLYTFLMKHYTPLPFLVDMKDLDKYVINKNSVAKTHCPYPQKNHKNNIKVVFMFGDIYNSAISYSRKDVWGKSAAKHLFLEEYSTDFLNKNLYNFERYFDNWTKKQNYPIMLVRYEKLYENLKQVLNFCDLSHVPISTFPPFKKRTTNWEDFADKEKLYNIYGALKERVDKLPDMQIIK